MTALLTATQHHRDVPDAIVAGVQAAQWPGMVLPQRRVAGFQVYPVVEIDERAWTERITGRCGPEYVLSTLYVWESWTTDLGPMPPAPAVSIVGFVSDRRPADARRALGALSGLGAGLVVSSGARRPMPITVMESDVAEMWAAWVPPGKPAQLLVRGRSGPAATARRLHLTRYFEELLFGWAVISHEVPVAWEWKKPTL
ncbi:hypothetical protein OS122_30255 [Mycolicibacterium mucogenicum]|uniref:hypothetical protein n=1 Tax=Mycolicibacterium mucogenicum TaxID=56689 RepID=UPI00226A59C4|nr:hypothetical protein [Mycolicibacterium mucogenicum]MCX8565170.1 hypothetical protein [Mycolicibacterium mucogenicum]